MNPSKPFTTTTAGFIVPMVTGTLSACSSGLIIYIISRSQQKLSTTYHRIMAFMSTFDIISSIFIALGTIMMPSDSIFKYAGPLLGNKVTCQIQGWLVVFGLCGSTSLNACLTWYFVCSIVFKVHSVTIRKRIEPFMHIYTVIIALFVPSFYLSKDLMNPSLYDNFCVIVTYPESCDDEKWYDLNECVWDESTGPQYWLLATITTAIHFGSIVTGMSIILWTIIRTSQHNKNNSRPLDENLEGAASESKTEDQGTKMAEVMTIENSRVLVLQALMYIAVFFLTWIFNLLSVVFNVRNDELDLMNSILFPLQGFWNFLIFLYDKTHIIRQYNSSLSFWQAVKKTLSEPSEASVIALLNLAIVENISDRKMNDKNPSVSESEPERQVSVYECKRDLIMGSSSCSNIFSWEKTDA